jgi:hypothetical protein
MGSHFVVGVENLMEGIFVLILMKDMDHVSFIPGLTHDLYNIESPILHRIQTVKTDRSGKNH